MVTSEVAAPERAGHPIGVRPPLEVVDLPTPEEVFNVPRVGTKEAVKFVLGPSLIALGISIGSGEWILGPLNVGTVGFTGIGIVITISALLQVFYNIEISRYVVATGEVPVVGFARVPPALLWAPLAMLLLFFAFIWGGWAKAAASGLFALINGEVPGEGDDTTVTLLAVLLLAVIFGISALTRKVTRGLEFVNLTSIGIQLIFLIIIDILFVPWDVWWDGLKGFLTPALPPEGTDVSLIGGLVGFTALASGLNWYVMNHYRDKGYGMGSRVGFIGGLRAEQREVAPVGMTFPDDEKNAGLWKRWMRLLKADIWIVFFGGAMIGMYLPTILVRSLVLDSGQEPTAANMPTFAAEILGEQHGRIFFYLALIVGFLILFDTQLGIFEALVRNATDSLNMSDRFRRLVSGDPRRFYYPFMIVLLILIGIFLQFFQDATELIEISANMSNLGALIFPFLLIYLIRKLPRAARPRWPSYIVLMLNVLYFGFFFLNYLWEKIADEPLYTF